MVTVLNLVVLKDRPFTWLSMFHSESNSQTFSEHAFTSIFFNWNISQKFLFFKTTPCHTNCQATTQAGTTKVSLISLAASASCSYNSMYSDNDKEMSCELSEHAIAVAAQQANFPPNQHVE